MAQPRFLKSEPPNKAALLYQTVPITQEFQDLMKGDYFFSDVELRVSIYHPCKQDFGPVTYILPPQRAINNEQRSTIFTLIQKLS